MDVKIRKILVSQPQPKSEKSPYFELAEKTQQNPEDLINETLKRAMAS